MASVTHPAVKAIPCTYSGVDMDSRLEAHWAAFFDGLDLPWVYEPAHYRKRGQDFRYTPDFALPSLDVLAEVKPDPPSLPHDLAEKYAAYWPWLVERGKCRMFVYLIGYPHPGATYAAQWKHGARSFSFTRAFGERAVERACVYSDHLNIGRCPPQDEPTHIRNIVPTCWAD